MREPALFDIVYALVYDYVDAVRAIRRQLRLVILICKGE